MINKHLSQSSSRGIYHVYAFGKRLQSINTLEAILRFTAAASYCCCVINLCIYRPDGKYTELFSSSLIPCSLKSTRFDFILILKQKKNEQAILKWSVAHNQLLTFYFFPIKIIPNQHQSIMNSRLKLSIFYSSRQVRITFFLVKYKYVSCQNVDLYRPRPLYLR